MKSLFVRIVPVLIIMSMLLGACATTLPQVPVVVVAPSETPRPNATSAPASTSVSPQRDDVWDRIVANKKIVIGTSWDYPPFASIDPNFQVDGFDIALIQEIGRRLNVAVDVQNFAFEGLPGALQLNQIDLAIAAISITPERASQMSFSPIYYVNETAVLARNDSQITSVTDINQLAGLRVGVQRGGTYESMLKSLLIDTGLIRADQMVSYVKADEMVRDLVAKKVDLVVTGLATANYYSTELGLKVVGKGFNQQNLAIAMRSDTPRLKAEIDRVMDEMLTDGTILGFIQKYIQNGAIKVEPTATPLNLPTVTPIPPVPTATPLACVNGVKFISDVTYPDNNMKSPPFFKPGTGFVKTWRVQNSGTCTWTTNYRLVFAYGNVDAARMAGQPLNIPGNVVPGQTIDLSVNLIAPKEPFTYQGFWQFENPAGFRFGQTIWVGISTQDDPGSTGQPAGNYCVVTNIPRKNPVVVHGSFDAAWTIKNISGGDWTPDSFDYTFVSGTAMQEKDTYDFTQTIKNGETGKIIVDMVAPAAPGTYAAKWAIVSGGKTICIMNVTVTVVAK